MRQGGSYEIDKKTGEPVLVHRTEDHPDGNAPRDERGNLIVDGRPVAAEKPTPKPKEK